MTEPALRAFVRVAEVGRMDLAAESLGYSQSSVSYQVKCLEQALGVRLFVRQQKRARLTSHGQMLLPSARAVLVLLAGMREAAGRGGADPASYDVV